MKRADSCDARPAGLIERLVTMWPALPFMALGIWNAWASLTYSGAFWLSDSETTVNVMSRLYNFSTISCALAFLIPALLVGFGSEKLLRNKKVIFAAAIVASLACLGIILQGPYYYGTQIREALGNIPYRACCVLSGLGTGTVALGCGMMYGGLPPRRVLIYSGFSTLLTVAIYCVAMCMPTWAPVAHGPSLASILLFCLLPLVMAFFVCMPQPSSVRGELAEAAPAEAPRTKLSGSFWRFTIFLFVVSFITAALRSSVLTLYPPESSVANNNAGSMLCLLLGFALVVYAVHSPSHGAGLGRVCSLVAVVAAILSACAAALVGMTSTIVVFLGFLSRVLNTLVWCLLAFIVTQRRVSALVVFGFGYGLLSLGSGLGWLMGYNYLSKWSTLVPSTLVYLLCAAVMLVLAVCLFSERDYERLFAVEEGDELSLKDLFQIDDVNAKKAPVAQSAAEEARSERKGRFREATERIAQRCFLSARESEVFRYIAMGYGSDRIADTLQVTVSTVRAHTHNIYVKLDVHSREELMRMVDDEIVSMAEPA